MFITQAHLAAALAFTIWGLLPLFWKLFEQVGAWDLFGHRLVWSFVTLMLILAYKRKLHLVREIWSQPRKRNLLILSALMISSNWYLYIYAIESHQVLEASMGYFLNPLINVLMGRLILKEDLRSTQWPSIILAAIAIILMALQAGVDKIPWLALTLAITFALYGLIRKVVQVGSLEGLTFETCAIIIPVMLYWQFAEPTTLFSAYALLPDWKGLILAGAGIMTCTPLVLFAFSAKRLPLRTLGFLQYLSPSLKFLCGLFVFKEILSPEKLQAFFMIWAALVWYTIESYYFLRKHKRAVPVPE
jgi:chloramphenicol-sensitive protein RarD